MIKARRGGQKYARTEAEREVFTVKVVGKGVERKLSHRQIYGLPPSVFQNKDSPDYKPNYGKKFTERQLKILNAEIPIEKVRLTEISIIMRKAESLGDEEYFVVSVRGVPPKSVKKYF